MTPRLRLPVAALGLAVLSAASWLGWLGWDHEYYYVDGVAQGPYRAWQVVGCGLCVAIGTVVAWAWARRPGSILVLSAAAAIGFAVPWSYDAAARLLEQAGASALATTSSAISWAHGYPDDNQLPADLALKAVRRIVDCVEIPVSADIESGYATSPAALAETQTRISAYAEAGLSGIFVPGTWDLDVIATLTASTSLPINVLAGPGDPTIADFRDVGVRRISVGNDLAALAWGAAMCGVREIVDTSSFDALEGGVAYGDMQGLMR